jgi:isoamylase
MIQTSSGASATSHLPRRAEIGLAHALGAICDGEGTNFAVYAGNAEEIDLCLFDATGRRELCRYALTECTDGVWHGYLPGIVEGQLYGYRAHGPYEPAEGHRYNVNKLLLDPYARKLAGALRWSDALFGYRLHSSRADLSFDRRDSAFAMPKAVVTVDRFDWGDDRHPRTPWRYTSIYELHVRGFTKLLSAVRERDRGSFAGLSSPAAIDYLKRLNITAVELLPVHAFVDDRMLLERGLCNYWGYNTLAFFAPEPRYLSDGGVNQVKSAIRSLHAAGIEVILDVVFNHTAEGSELGPTLSLRGLDNAAYYRLLGDNRRHNINDTGCGNTVNFSHPRVIQLAMDSLRYWVQHYHVDGFRFDLGVTLGREPHGFDRSSGFFDALMQDPVLAPCKLISEPWDTGPGGYQLGNHPPGMGEWNGAFRDDVRKFWRGDPGMRSTLAARLQGSADLFDHDGRRPWESINFVTSHDGFTLADWASYNGKHNDANGEENRDGDNNNNSNNWGAEGPTSDPAILETRRRVTAAMLATLLFSDGTPMLTAGDENGRSQNGNNNGYCQDNELSWFDWHQAQSTESQQLRAFVARLLQLRREYRSLRSSYFQHGRVEPWPKVRDIEWFDEKGKTMRPEDWQYGEGRLLCVRRALRLDEERTEVSLLLINNTADVHAFDLPGPLLPWVAHIDSAQPDLADHDLSGPQVELAARSVQLLTAIVTAQQGEPAVHSDTDKASEPQAETESETEAATEQVG